MSHRLRAILWLGWLLLLRLLRLLLLLLLLGWVGRPRGKLLAHHVRLEHLGVGTTRVGTSRLLTRGLVTIAAASAVGGPVQLEGSLGPGNRRIIEIYVHFLCYFVIGKLNEAVSHRSSLYFVSDEFHGLNLCDSLKKLCDIIFIHPRLYIAYPQRFRSDLHRLRICESVRCGRSC